MLSRAFSSSSSGAGHHGIKSSSPFYRLVEGLKNNGKTCTVIESCCGGLINSGIMAIPGSSGVYYGGSVAYNTKRAKKLLCDDSKLHETLLANSSSSEAGAYIQSKLVWTGETAKAFCEHLNVDYAISEGGASGPTFRPEGLTKGFAALAIAGRDDKTGKVEVLAQKVIHSPHADRQKNMRLFADSAAELALETIMGISSKHESKSLSGASTEAGFWLNRATHLRTDQEALDKLEKHPNAKCVVLLDSNQCLMKSSEDGTFNNLIILPMDAPPIHDDFLPKSFLGLDPDQNPIFAVDITNKESISNDNLLIGGTFQNTRTHAPLLPAHENELALYATALSQWKRTHKFCSQCGSPLTPIQGGTCLKCTSCDNHSWPRQDPSIIVLVTNRNGDKALMARSPRHGPKLHTALAGFVEAGETFEQAVMREAFEETGIRVDPDSISYLSSQPWPFPRSCMIAFRATADDQDQEINIDPNELVSAYWFDKAKVQKAATVRGATMNHDVAAKALEEDSSLEVLIPPKGVVARTLIDNWLSDA
mmetsp:Transcript_19078/g.29048  ORF Transcript_19078/g.29048 Transcript_19078/m.29048 type:complete len:536 (-) Transcript_19078:2039-3646(-)